MMKFASSDRGAVCKKYRHGLGRAIHGVKGAAAEDADPAGRCLVMRNNICITVAVKLLLRRAIETGSFISALL